MIIKKFVGKTEEEATETARKELGNSLVVMNVKTTKKKDFQESLAANRWKSLLRWRRTAIR